MPRAAELDLRSPAQPWRQVPMPGANTGLDVVPLESAAGALTMLAHFPAGFARLTPGGYEGTEEFLVVDGELEFEGVSYGRGSLTYIPARHLRTRMVTPGGCTVLAWWGGSAEFLPADQLGGAVEDGIVSTVPDASSRGQVLSAGRATWTTHLTVPAEPPTEGDCVDLALTRWQRAAAPGAVASPFLHRSAAR